MIPCIGICAFKYAISSSRLHRFAFDLHQSAGSILGQVELASDVSCLGEATACSLRFWGMLQAGFCDWVELLAGLLVWVEFLAMSHDQVGPLALQSALAG